MQLPVGPDTPTSTVTGGVANHNMVQHTDHLCINVLALLKVKGTLPSYVQ